MQGISVLVVDDNDKLRQALAAHLAVEEGITVAGQARDGAEALRFLQRQTPDVMLLDIVMPQLDGFGVLEALKNARTRPHIIMLTALSREDFVARALTLGAEYYIVKPADPRALGTHIRAVASGEPLSERVCDMLAPKSALCLDEKLSNLFLSMGIPAHIKGYSYLREAVKQTIARPPLIGSITKELYPAVARQFGTSAGKVERAIRHAIEVAWSRGRVDTLNTAFGCRVAHPADKPTNGEFIAMLSDKLSMQGQ